MRRKNNVPTGKNGVKMGEDGGLPEDKLTVREKIGHISAQITIME